MSWLKETFGSHKPVIAMAHLPPLPGAPLYDAAGGMAAIIDYVGRDLENLQAAGVDCVMFGNEGDRPYLLAKNTKRDGKRLVCDAEGCGHAEEAAEEEQPATA